MNTDELIALLSSRHIKLKSAGDNIEYYAPEGAMTEAIARLIKTHKPQLLRLLTQQSEQACLRAIAPLPVDKKQPIAASFAQEQLLFIEHYEGAASKSHNIPWTLQLTGPLNAAWLVLAFNALVARHDILRTRFCLRNGNAIELVSQALTVTMPVITVMPEHTQSLIQHHAQHSFNVSQGPLIKLSLLCVSANEHILLLNLHHIIADGWSITVLMNEIKLVYNAFARGQKPALTPLPMQYGDYANWQRQCQARGVFEQQLRYWQQQLNHCPALLELPYDHQRPEQQRFYGDTYRFLLPTDLQQALTAFSQSAGTTLFITLISGFYLLLSRYSGQSDICVGTAVANRSQPAFHHLVGFFANTLPLRMQIKTTMTFYTLVQEVRTMAAAAYANQEVPFEAIVKAVNPHRSSRYSPLFQCMFTLQQATQHTTEFHGIKTRTLQSHTFTSKYDMSLMLTDTQQGIEAALEYNTDLFTVQTIEQFCYHYQQILRECLFYPYKKLCNIPTLTPREHQQLSIHCNDSRSVYPRTHSIPLLFDARVNKTPDTVALRFNDQQLTYCELQKRSNQLAHYLIAQQVRPGDKVGLCVDKSLSMVVAMLGILKAGACYVPINPQYPRQHIDMLVNDSQLTTLITHTMYRDCVSAQQSVNCICIDSQFAAINTCPAHSPAVNIDSRSFAYIMYTSGSTGAPKGVIICHRAIIALVINNQFIHYQKAGRILQLSSIAFDAATFEIWSALLNGYQCVIYPQRYFSLESLAAVVLNAGITTLLLTTAVLNLVIDEKPAVLKPLLQIFTGGDSICCEHIKRAYALYPGIIITNLYGATEATTCSTYYPVPQKPATFLQPIPIGLPISNTRVYVLDDTLNIVPTRASGELYISGDGLAHGYLNQPALTAERFIPDPFARCPGERMYRSGDSVKQNASGHIVFLARVDQQIKIRGFRIEPAEIENALLRQPGILDATVIASKTPSNSHDARLVAYVVCKHNRYRNKHTLKKRLQKELVAHMLPDAFVFLAQLPLTCNGKVDRNALPSPHCTDFFTHEYSAAETELEIALQNIWADILQIPADKISVRESFFDLGGHSLLAIQFVARVQEQLKLELTVKALFEQPTIYALGEYLQQQRSDSLLHQAQLNCPLSRAKTLTPTCLSFAQQRLWFVNQYENQSGASYNMPVALQLTGPVNLQALQCSFYALVARHSILRTTFQLIERQPMQVVAPEIALAIPLISVKASQVTHYIAQHSQRIFNLTTGPLLHVLVLHVTHRQFYLLVNLHHIIADEHSFSLLFQELSLLYDAFCNGQCNPLPPLAIQYSDFSRWQRQWLQGDVLAQQLAYWKKQLADKPALLTLPTDKPRPGVLTPRGDSVEEIYSVDLTRRVQAFCRQQKVTVFMFALSVFHLLLSRYSASDDIFTGSAATDRSHPTLEPLIGFFINMLVLRTRVTGTLTFKTYLQHVKATTLQAFDYQDAPFEAIVEHLQPTRSTAHHALFNIAFGVQNKALHALQLHNTVATPVDSALKTAKFDLFLQLYDCGVQADKPECLSVSLEYNTHLFERGSATAMLRHYQQLLEAVISSPQKPLMAFSMLPDCERQQLLKHFNHTDTDLRQHRCIHELFEHQVALHPMATALVFNEQSITYAQLNQQANQLAHFLRVQGVGADTLVGVCVERSIAMVTSILAIVKAGGAYVPFDPLWPPARLTFMLKDSGVTLLLTQRHLSKQLPTTDQNVIFVDNSALNVQATHNLPISELSLRAEHLAYVIYTSGSTGQPKGVLLQHKGLVNLCNFQQRFFSVDGNSRIVQFASLSFDAATWEIFMALSHGATLQLLTQEQATTPALLFAHIQQCKITHATLPPTLLDNVSPDGLKYPRTLIVAGESITHKTARAWSKNRCLFNAYGPTETTVCVSVGRYDGKAVHMGRPIDNTRCYVLDNSHALCPPGIAGELYVSAVGVARGYLNRPALTAQAFTASAISAEGGERWYRTGDCVRWRQDGTLEFIARIDEQVKIRGYRIECGEIEQTLNRHESVAKAIVLAREDAHAQQQLIAYVSMTMHGSVVDDTQPASGHPATQPAQFIRVLRSWLHTTLPHYMQPAFYVVVDKWPLSATGKIDKRALLNQQDITLHTAHYQAAETPLQHQLVNLWEQVLNVKGIGINDDFFESGGHSLLASAVINQLCDDFYIPLQVRDLFACRTINNLSMTIEQLLLDRRAAERIQSRTGHSDGSNRDEFIL